MRFKLIQKSRILHGLQVHGASVDLDGEEVGGMTREDTMESLLSNTTLDTTI